MGISRNVVSARYQLQAPGRRLSTIRRLRKHAILCSTTPHRPARCRRLIPPVVSRTPLPTSRRRNCTRRILLSLFLCKASQVPCTQACPPSMWSSPPAKKLLFIISKGVQNIIINAWWSIFLIIPHICHCLSIFAYLCTHDALWLVSIVDNASAVASCSSGGLSKGQTTPLQLILSTIFYQFMCFTSNVQLFPYS